MEKNIGIDIDGVITDETHVNENIWHHALCEFMGCDLKRIAEKYPFTEAYGLKSGVVYKFLEEYEEEIYRNITPLKGVRETIDYLLQRGCNIYLITARKLEFEELTVN